MCWATYWAIFSHPHLVTLGRNNKQERDDSDFGAMTEPREKTSHRKKLFRTRPSKSAQGSILLNRFGRNLRGIYTKRQSAVTCCDTKRHENNCLCKQTFTDETYVIWSNWNFILWPYITFKYLKILYLKTLHWAYILGTAMFQTPQVLLRFRQISAKTDKTGKWVWHVLIERDCCNLSLSGVNEIITVCRLVIALERWTHLKIRFYRIS
jgi:hypothetical protein